MWKLNNTGIAYTYEDSKCIYKEFIENKHLKKNIATYGNKNFPIVLREHFYGDIHIEEKVTPLDYPEITQAKLHKHLKNIKKNKATEPDYVKGELYRALVNLGSNVDGEGWKKYICERIQECGRRARKDGFNDT